MGRVDVNISQELLDAFWHDPIGQPVREINRRANNIQAAIKREAPVRTGKTRASVRKQPPSFGRTVNTISMQIDIGSDGLTPYLGYILDGTPPHVITPKGAHTRAAGAIRVSKKNGRAYRVRKKVHTKALRFVMAGSVVYRTRVFHPGTTANDFISRGLKIGFEE